MCFESHRSFIPVGFIFFIKLARQLLLKNITGKGLLRMMRKLQEINDVDKRMDEPIRNYYKL